MVGGGGLCFKCRCSGLGGAGLGGFSSQDLWCRAPDFCVRASLSPNVDP